MNTKEIIDNVRKSTGLKKTVVEDVFRAIITEIGAGVAIQGRVEVFRLGTFNIRHIAAQSRKSPKTGEVVHSEAKRRVVFRACPDLRNLPEGL